MRLLVLHAGNLYGGTERVVETIARERGVWQTAGPASSVGLDGQSARAAIARTGQIDELEPRFALCFDAKLAEHLRQMRVEFDLLGPARFSRPDLVVRARHRLTHLLKRDRYDIVITQSVWSHAVFAPVVRRLRVPLALWVHDLLNGQHWVEKLAQRWQPDLLICNSRHTEAAARTVFPNIPAEIIHGPISLAGGLADRRRADHSQVRLRGLSDSDPRTLSVHPAFGDADGRTVIAHVGRMVPLKGHRTLIDALARLPLDPSWTCWFVGGPQTDEEAQYERGLREQVAALNLDGRVRFLGTSDDVMSILRRAHIYCQPNELPEAFGLSFVEALHAGVPVVTTDMGGAKEIVTDACGRLVPPGNVDALASTLRWLIEHPAARRTLGRNGPARAWMLCNPEARLEQLRVALGRIAIGAAA